jgi:BirA family biotin operon repressor/biotin-[acetyl-CoA-carboxylase] ligase
MKGREQQDRTSVCLNRKEATLSFDLQRIETDTFIRKVELYSRLPSTNDRAMTLAESDDIVLPLLVLCEHQTSGRGRGANRWWSSNGALTFSLVVETGLLSLWVDQPTCISLSAGLAVCETLVELLPSQEIGLKWPNDVYLEGKKVCGILAESPSPKSGRIVIGIGINVNNSLKTAPEELQSSATSLFDVTGRQFELTGLLVRTIQHFENQVTSFQCDDSQLIKSWQQFCLLQGRSVTLNLGSEQVTGTCSGIDAAGHLILQTEAGPRHFSNGVVSRIE